MVNRYWQKLQVRSDIVGVVLEGYFRALVPASVRREILKLAHEHETCGHLGRQRTIHRLKSRFFWPGMCKDAKDFCNECVLCQRRHRPSPKKRAPMITEATSRPFKRIAIDITEMPTSASGNKCALVVMDYFSKYVKIYPMPDQKTETVLEALFDRVYELGVPERLHSDQGRQFESDMFQLMCKRMGIRKTRTTPYHPESDGMVERFMRTLKDMVAKYIDSEGLRWDRNVKAYAMAYNSSVHTTTGHTPFFLIHGFEPVLPMDVMYGPPKELLWISDPVRPCFLAITSSN